MNISEIFNKVLGFFQYVRGIWSRVDPAARPLLLVLCGVSIVISSLCSFLVTNIYLTKLFTGRIVNPLSAQTAYDSTWVTSFQGKFALYAGSSDYIPFYCLKGQKVRVYLRVSKIGGTKMPFNIQLDDMEIGADFKDIDILANKEFMITDKINFIETPARDGKYHKLGFLVPKSKDFYKRGGHAEDRVEIECVIFVCGRIINL